MKYESSKALITGSGEGSEMTLREIYQYVEELKAPILSQQSLRTNSGFFYNHIDPYFGSRAIRTIQYIDYQRFANDLLAGRSRCGYPLKPKTVKNIFNVLRSIYKLARVNNWYDGPDHLELVELPRFDNRRYFTLDVEHQKRYIKAILSFDEPIYKDIFLFLLHGRRLREVLELQWQYLDLNQGVMYLPAKINKSKKNLSFQLTDRLVDALKVLKKEAIEDQGTPFVSGYVFLNPKTGRPFTDLRKAWKRCLARADLPMIRIHDIRHLVATYSINVLEVPIEKVSHTLGHTDIKITQSYINPRPENAKEVIQSVFDSVENVSPLKELDRDLQIANRVRDLFNLIERR